MISCQQSVQSINVSTCQRINVSTQDVNSPEMKAFIKENSALFWWVKEEEKENVDHKMVVETLLNYGDIGDVKKLFSLLGIEKVAAIFRRQISRPRNNYSERTKHFFSLYFQKHVH